ncbi:MAG: phage major capsid protein [Lachnospiraceae bacterium]|nr:phage major capsid protein [Lachnospiraceae bacterium]
MNEAQALLDAGKVEEATAKMEEVKALDAEWDAIAQAEADLNALNRVPAPALRVDEGGLPGAASGAEEDPVAAALRSEDYRFAWAKTLMGKPLNAKERDIYNQVNGNASGAMSNEVHTTKNTGILIPETVTKGIWEQVEEKHPYYGDITKTYVNGILTMIKEKASSEAGWYEEDEETRDGEETFEKYTLSGCELARNIKVSWKLREMAIEDFIPYIQRKMAKKMGAAIGYGVIHGKGERDKSRREPVGVATALYAEAGTPQIVAYAGVPTYEDIINAVASVGSEYGAGLKIYANHRTVWHKLAMIMDQNGRPIFIADPISGGVKHLLGIPIREEDGMRDGEILFSNAADGYHANINKALSMMTEEHVTKRYTDYAGYAILDGDVLDTRAHVLLTEQASEPAANAEAGAPVSGEPAASSSKKADADKEES